jgi:L-threonylcarbamoyladenylate synthase
MPEILKVNADYSEESVLTRAAAIVISGGVIAYPTETFYGLGVDATNEQAMRRIFDIKGRNFSNPISVIISERKNVYPLVRDVTRTAERLMDAFWPGPLTIVFTASAEVSPLLTAGSGKIGIRLSSHEGAGRIAQIMGRPLTATSANLSNQPECANAAEVIKQIGNKIDAIVDFGRTIGDKVSTVIDVSCDPPVILREGIISRQSIEKFINQVVSNKDKHQIN